MDTSTTPRISDEEVALCIEQLTEAGVDIQADIKEKGFVPKIQRICDKTRRRARTLRGLIELKLAQQHGKIQNGRRITGNAREFSNNGNTQFISYERVPIKTAEELLEYAGIDQDVWECEKIVVNQWEMGFKDSDGEAHAKPLYQVKCWLKRKVVEVAAREWVDELIAKAKAHAPAYTPMSYPINNTGNVVELSIPDLHLSKLAWGPETGWEDWDIQLAEQAFRDAVVALIERTAYFNPEEYLFVIGNDLFNMDNMANTTTKGTPQRSDTRYHKVYQKAFDLMVWAIDLMRERARVVVKIVPGNHDLHACFHLGHSLDCWYHTDTAVDIDNAPIARKVYEWGVVGLMFTHGDGGKKKDFPITLAIENRAMFGRTTWNEIHTGHWHKSQTMITQADEYQGIRVRTLPSMCPPDDWHSANFYVGAIRNAESFVWNKDEGHIATIIYSIPRDKKEADTNHERISESS